MSQTEWRVEQSSPATQASRLPLVLHYTGYDEDYGGVTVTIKRLATVGAWRTQLGLNAGAIQRREPRLEVIEFPRVAAEAGGLRSIWAGWLVALRARRWLRENPDGIFHAHSRAGAVATALLRSIGETRVLATVHVFGHQRGWYRQLSRLLAGRLFWLSPRMKEFYGLGRATWSECLPDCVSEIVAGVRKPRDEARVFGAVGPIVAVKEWPTLVEAWARLPGELRDRLKLVHVGGPRTEEQHAGAEALRRFAAERDLANAIEWRPRTESIQSFWDEIDCYVGTSPREAFGVAALEALAAGVPLLVPTAAGTSDLVEECRGGRCFDGGAAALAEAIERCARPGALRGWSPDLAALRRFSASNVAARHAEIYRTLLCRANQA